MCGCVCVGGLLIFVSGMGGNGVGLGGRIQLLKQTRFPHVIWESRTLDIASSSALLIFNSSNVHKSSS